MVTRICFVTPQVYGYFNSNYGYTGGGAERQVHLLSTALTDRFDVHVIVGDYRQSKTENCEGVTLHRAYPIQSRENIFQPAKHLLILADAMRRADADVYVHRGGPRNAVFVYLITRLLGKKWVYNIANDANIVERPKALPKPIFWMFQRAVRNADVIIAQTDYQRSRLQEFYERDASVVPNGYPVATELCTFAERESLLWVGSFSEDQKRPHLLLELAESLPNQQFRLVGPIDESVTYQQQIAQRAAEIDNVTLVGAIAPDDIHEEYRNAIALVNTSAYEGFPNTFLEAWRQGTPVLSLDVDPGRYLPFETVDGYTGGDLQELVEQCRQLATNQKRWQSWAHESRELFELELEIGNVTRRYSDVLQSIINGP